jgi:tetratricopeptide (TPR) repeat protein
LWLEHRAVFWGLRGDLQQSVADFQRLFDLRATKVASTNDGVLTPFNTVKGRQAYDARRLADAYALCGEMHDLHKDFESALTAYQKAAKVSPELLERCADLCERREFSQPYEDTLSKLVKRIPPWYLHFLRRAKFYMEQGDFAKAKADFGAAVNAWASSEGLISRCPKFSGSV